MEQNELDKEYTKRINLALIYIDENLGNDLSLEIIAQCAYFSPYHFHRLFKAIIGETLNAYIARKRIEKTASILLKNNEISISELALQYGYNSNAAFTKAFKKFYGISPSQFRKVKKGKYSKIGKVESKNGQKELLIDQYISNINHHLKWIAMHTEIEIKEMPAKRLAYVAHSGKFKEVGKAYQKLINWAETKGVLKSKEFEKITIYHDNPNVNEQTKVRSSACLIIDEKVEVDGDIGLLLHPKGKCVVARF
ncbi:AraC family transcriptional regulator [Crocinitomix catalasitica]|uniref:AraC family transcriptional regulator n=1 Tax=Crocinitomix catalasitica TaxID=184607 RepID=UPI000687E1D0|nr:AraC family transcriptional regulator [Crocinitomix catalasitica]